MGTLSHRLQLKVSQKQVLTPGLVQMVTVLQMNSLELKELISQEMIDNPVIEEMLDGGDEITPEELQPLLEAERNADPADRVLLEALRETEVDNGEPPALEQLPGSVEYAADQHTPDTPTNDPFDEIDFGSFFDEYLAPGHKTPAS